METPAEYKAPKIYVIAGIRYRLVKCTPVRAEIFDQEIQAVKTPLQKMELAKSVLERADPNGTLPDPDWNQDFLMPQVLEVLTDFLSLYGSIYAPLFSYWSALTPSVPETRKSE
ncbi:MAG: hypothetical protein HUU10_15595 [Bacteroidetes bacterium]|nr:hypothetical protein [Bacteroidota bacterium]